MPLAVLYQQPFEAIRYRVSYEEWLTDPTEQLLSVTPVITPTTSTPLSVTTALTSGRQFDMLVEGGEDRTTYALALRVVTSRGQRHEVDFAVRVYDR